MKKIEGWVTAPQGFLAAGVKAGIKASGNHDVAVIYSTVPAAAGAVFTQNKMCAAPVLVSREVAQEAAAQAIIVNSGCANACTGEQGLLDAKEMQTFAAGLLGIEPQQVYVCSTGVIGHFLPMDKIKTGLADAIDAMDEAEGESCAMAIQTTDTFIKRAAYEFEVGGKTAKIAGIAHERGKGMIIAVNKWDALEKDDKTIYRFTEKVRNTLAYMPYAELLFISAKTGQRLPKLFETIDMVLQYQNLRVQTGVLNEILTEAMAMQQPPSDRGKRLKIYYMTQVSVKPPTFVIFVNDKELMHFSYVRYLENKIRESFGFRGTPLKFIIRERKEKEQ